MADNFVLITGCSGGGKSSLLTELAARGYAAVEEPGRRIVRQARGPDDPVLPWNDPAAFARRAVEMALADREAARGLHGWVFFDRGVVDAASALEAATGEPSLRALDRAHRYHRRVFLAPPWPQLHTTDAERRHGFDAALEEHQRLEAALPALDYEVIVLPRTSVAGRADFVLAILEA
ncbi:AAA family ATPase [Caulobacter endophyticus]|uniref:ATPase n=1 Tax=Caulobacter endophyticus TaxID=2172652 RepID=A0A2T9JUN9_9CAUL|nr:AAA family ATPase [Caulobacter endophyticus]PVM87410.1 ATPase [Caulobacter endophyticus]